MVKNKETTTMKYKLQTGLAAVCAAMSSATAQDAVNVPMKVDHRGLIEMPGVFRQNSEHHWGAANLIVYGPTWGFTAQDFALKNIKRDGNATDMKLTGDLSVSGVQMKVEQESKMVKRADGSSALEMKWKISHPEGKPMGIQKAYVQFPFAVKDVAGAKIKSDSGAEAVFPEETGDIRAFYGTDGVTFDAKNREGKGINFRLTGKGLSIENYDARKEKNPATAYYVRVLLPKTKDASSSEVTFAVNASFLPFSFKADADWVEFPDFVNDPKPGTILDFSFINNDAPAGKHGRVVPDKNGNFVFEKTGKRVRFTGANLCFGALFLEKEECDALAQTFRRLGYNSVRFHHIDVTLMKGEWNNWNARKVPVEIDMAQLDKLDYLFAAMKKAGIYMTFDFYCMGLVDANGIGVRSEKFKARNLVDEDTFRGWMKNVLFWMNHVNPYTGIAWKDDPAIVAICPVNEDSIMSVWRDEKERMDELFDVWLGNNAGALAAAAAGQTKEQLRARFLTEFKVAANRRLEKFIRDNGIKAPLTGANWWNQMSSTFERDTFDVVDNHQYADHPFGPGNRTYNQKSAVKGAENASYMIPTMMAPNRIFGKPFIVTEFNFCPPNMYRAEGGGLMGAYAALQDWDGLYRFAWSHDAKTIRTGGNGADGFNIATDPVSILTERQIMLLFGRGDVAPAKDKFVYAVSMDEAVADGADKMNMWGGGFFPKDFVSMSLVSQIGSQIAGGTSSPLEKGRAIQGKFNAVSAKTEPAAAALGGNKFVAVKDLPKVNAKPDVVSDTGEITINGRQGNLRIDTPKTALVVAPAKTAPLTAGPLTVSDVTTFCSVSASAMDGRDIDDSRRILLFHITNVINTDMRFADASMTQKLGNGTLPHLAKTGGASVSIRNSNANLKLYPVKFDGTRLPPLPAFYTDGTYTFTLAVAANPTMIYELAP